jgi:hypothetical protein
MFQHYWCCWVRKCLSRKIKRGTLLNSLWGYRLVSSGYNFQGSLILILICINLLIIIMIFCGNWSIRVIISLLLKLTSFHIWKSLNNSIVKMKMLLLLFNHCILKIQLIIHLLIGLWNLFTPIDLALSLNIYSSILFISFYIFKI